MGNRQRSMKKHTARRKAARLALEQAQKLLRKTLRPKKQAVSHEVYARAQVEENPKNHDRRISITFRPALLGHPNQPKVVIDDVELVGMAEDPQEFGEFVATVGITTLASLTGLQLTPETKMGAVIEAVVKMMGVDLEELKKRAAEEAKTDEQLKVATEIAEQHADTLQRLAGTPLGEDVTP